MMRTLFHASVLRLVLAALCGTLLVPSIGSAVPAGNPESYVRIVRDHHDDPVSLDTAIVSFAPVDAAAMPSATPFAPGDAAVQLSPPSESILVDLVSAVHVGEPGYYRSLNERFKSYDAVLFELVADKNADVRAKAEGSTHPVSLLQMGLKNVLKLDFQLDAIDYRAANMVHADMSPEQLSRSMAARNESFGTLMLRAMTAAMARDNQTGGKPPDLGSVFLLLFDDARAMALRRLMAREFEDIDQLLATINGPEGSAILNDRNRVALIALRQALLRGKKRIAIFYGGAHMPDLARHLQSDFNLNPVATEWLVAWKLK